MIKVYIHHSAEVRVKTILYSGGRAPIDEASGALAEELLSLLRAHGLTISCAESCTGGMIAERITDIPGCSTVFPGGIVSYAETAKEQILGVAHETIAAYGVVSAQVAAEMASGVCRTFGTEVGVSVTGIAGPGGGTATKPVGLVYIGIRVCEREEVIKLTVNRNFSRRQIRNAAAGFALSETISLLKEKFSLGY